MLRGPGGEQLCDEVMVRLVDCLNTQGCSGMWEANRAPERRWTVAISIQ